MTDVMATEHTDEAPVGTTISTGTARRRPVTVPTGRYISPAFAELEHERLWPNVWQVACSVDHVARAGDVFEFRVGRLSVIIVRGNDGVLRAFQNVCRHRGSELCNGSTTGATELRCPYHRWTWDLTGRLREVPSRKGFGELRNEDYGLFPVHVDVWGPLVFVNLAATTESLADFLGEVPGDIAWCGIDDFHCRYLVSIPVECNWKTLIEGFSETYHVQGIHREMLGMTDDVNSPQLLWERHGKLTQPYGVPSPRLRRRPDDQGVWEAFVTVMGERAGRKGTEPAGPHPQVHDGETLRDALAREIRSVQAGRGLDFDRFDTAQLLDMSQYNLFPNVTAVVFPDVLSVVRARPGDDPDHAIMDAFVFDRLAPGSEATRPLDITLAPGADLPIGLVLSQDVGNFARAQRGLHQPGLQHLTLSAEECRIVNLHRNLERVLGITPTEIGPLDS